MSNIDNGGVYACVRAGGIWEICVPPSQFCYKPKTILKNKVLKKFPKHVNFFDDLMFDDCIEEYCDSRRRSNVERILVKVEEITVCF